MRTKPTLMFAASAFIVTTVLFAAAMVVAHSLSIPDPAERFLPSVARDLPSGTDADGMELANDDRSGQGLGGEPTPVVTAVPEPPSGADAGSVPDDAASVVSSSADTVANVTDGPAPFATSTDGTPRRPKKYTGPGWPSWGGSPAGWEPDPQPSESESEEPEPPGPSTESPSEPAGSEVPPPWESSEPSLSDTPSPEPEHEPSEPVASEDATG